MSRQFLLFWLEKHFFLDERVAKKKKKKPGCNVSCENSDFKYLNIIVLVCGKIEMIFSFM